MKHCLLFLLFFTLTNCSQALAEDVVGRWQFEYLNQKQIISIVKETDRYFIKEEYSDGSVGKHAATRTTKNGRVSYRKVKNHNGDYLEIKPDGNLGHYTDEEGWWLDSTKLH